VLKTWPPSLLRKIRFLDVGGGYWPEPGEWLHAHPSRQGRRDTVSGAGTASLTYYGQPAAAIETFAGELGRAIRGCLDFLFPCTLWFEPGRWICHDSMQLMMSVADKKASDLVITDAGINAVGWERFEADYFPVLNLTRPSLNEKVCLICGSLCTPHDIFGFSYFGEDILMGDVLLIPAQGAYTYSLRQDFIKPVPKVAIMSPGPGDATRRGNPSPDEHRHPPVGGT
jgi:diaminopimelate decarboxylase